MKTDELIREIKSLPLSKKILLLEKIAHSIGEQEDSKAMSTAAEELYTDYLTNKELTAFTDIDFEHFYETK